MTPFLNAYRILKPLIFVCWIIAALRLVAEFATDDVNVIAMLSVYSTLFVLFLFSAFTGCFDSLRGASFFAGALLIGVTCSSCRIRSPTPWRNSKAGTKDGSSTTRNSGPSRRTT